MLVLRGGIHIGEKVRRCQDAGAVGCIVANVDQNGEHFDISAVGISDSITIPTLTVSTNVGKTLAVAAMRGKVAVTLYHVYPSGHTFADAGEDGDGVEDPELPAGWSIVSYTHDGRPVYYNANTHQTSEDFPVEPTPQSAPSISTSEADQLAALLERERPNAAVGDIDRATALEMAKAAAAEIAADAAEIAADAAGGGNNIYDAGVPGNVYAAVAENNIYDAGVPPAKSQRKKKSRLKNITLTVEIHVPSGQGIGVGVKHEDGQNRVSGLAQGENAEKSGKLQPGDRFMKINGFSVSSASREDCIAALKTACKAGENMTIKLQRKNPDHPDNQVDANQFNAEVHVPAGESIGIGVLHANGVNSISQMRPEGNADKSDQLLVGDRFMNINGKDVSGSSREECIAALKAACAAGEVVKLGMWREGGSSVSVGAPPASNDIYGPKVGAGAGAGAGAAGGDNDDDDEDDLVALDDVADTSPITVVIRRSEPGQKLGMGLIGPSNPGDKRQGVYVSKITPGGAVSQCAEMMVGLRILGVDGVDTTNLKKKEVSGMLKEAGDTVTMVVVVDGGESQFGIIAPTVTSGPDLYKDIPALTLVQMARKRSLKVPGNIKKNADALRLLLRSADATPKAVAPMTDAAKEAKDAANHARDRAKQAEEQLELARKAKADAHEHIQGLWNEHADKAGLAGKREIMFGWFRTLDTNGDGVLDSSELRAGFHRADVQHGLKHVLHLDDADEDIDEDELMRHMDGDGDGSVSVLEFLRAVGAFGDDHRKKKELADASKHKGAAESAEHAEAQADAAIAAATKALDSANKAAEALDALADAEQAAAQKAADNRRANDLKMQAAKQQMEKDAAEAAELARIQDVERKQKEVAAAAKKAAEAEDAAAAAAAKKKADGEANVAAAKNALANTMNGRVVTLAEINEKTPMGFKLEGSEGGGASVMLVEPGGVADGKLLVGDVIVAINGENMEAAGVAEIGAAMAASAGPISFSVAAAAAPTKAPRKKKASVSQSGSIAPAVEVARAKAAKEMEEMMAAMGTGGGSSDGGATLEEQIVKKSKASMAAASEPGALLATVTRPDPSQKLLMGLVGRTEKADDKRRVH